MQLVVKKAWQARQRQALVVLRHAPDVPGAAALYDSRKVALTAEEEERVEDVLARRDAEIIVENTNANLELDYTHMHCLNDRAWLNDEVINFHFQLMRERANRIDEGKPDDHQLKCHFFNSFFTVKFNDGYVYRKIKRWSKSAKVKIVELDKVFVPCHVGNNHWCLAVINFMEKRFEYYDSLGGQPRGNLLPALRRYVVDEAALYSNQPDYDLSDWVDYIPGRYSDANLDGIPHQNNGSDCGMFTCKFADYLSENLDLTFSCQDMPYFRKRMVLDLLKNRLA